MSFATLTALQAPVLPFRADDLGFSRWETVAFKESRRYFDVYFARPRNRTTACSFLLKALKPRLCATTAGAALVERERCLGSFGCSRLLPVVDYVRPRLFSPTLARRGCVVVPYFPGKTLAERLDAGERFSAKTLRALESDLKSALAALRRRGWSSGELTPDRVLLSDAPSPDAAPRATLVDFSNARRWETPSLLADAPLNAPIDAPFAETFDPEFDFAPDAFFDAAASPESDLDSLRRLLKTLENADAIADGTARTARRAA